MHVVRHSGTSIWCSSTQPCHLQVKARDPEALNIPENQPPTTLVPNCESKQSRRENDVQIQRFSTLAIGYGHDKTLGMQSCQSKTGVPPEDPI